MHSVRQFLWNVFVVGMIPFILGAGLPQMECRCAAAKGHRYCECCFRKTSVLKGSNSALMPCCQRQLPSRVTRGESAVAQSASGCPTCLQHANPITGSCCSLRSAQCPTLSKQVEVSQLDAETWCSLLMANASQVPVYPLAVLQNVRTLANCRIPPLDRVIVFEHLVI